MSHAIAIDSLAVHFGSTRAVEDVSFTLDFGEIGVVLGPNGAGKTTTAETMLGFRSPTHGSVRVLGLDPVRDHRDVVARTGALLQRGGVWFPMSPRDVLKLTSTYYAAPRDRGELLGELDLQRCARTPWRRLSGGEQQRTLLALALIGRPRVLVLDEPSSAIDPAGHLVVRSLLQRERDRGCAILVTTHDLADAEALATKVVILSNGRVVADGSLESIATAPVMVFETSLAVDATELGRRLGATVTTDGTATYRCALENTDERLSALTSYLTECGARLLSLRSQPSLEETYLSLLANESAHP